MQREEGLPDAERPPDLQTRAFAQRLERASAGERSQPSHSVGLTLRPLARRAPERRWRPRQGPES